MQPFYSLGIIYRKYDVVRQNGLTYTCMRRHIAENFESDLAKGFWQKGVVINADIPLNNKKSDKISYVEKLKMNRYIIAPIVAILLAIALVITVATILSGCSSISTNQKDSSLISCINGYKRENPSMSVDLAYNYCSAMQGIVEKK